MDKAAVHTIGEASARTGLSTDVIRVWERRYGALAPERTRGGQRLYSAADLERLSLLRRGTESGLRIGNLARLSTAELRRLLARGGGRSGDAHLEERATDGGSFLAAALGAVEAMDVNALERVLGRAALALGRRELLAGVLGPLLDEIGERWRTGRLSVAGEHLATAVVRPLLDRVRWSGEEGARGRLLVTTPVGQVHELGALLVAAAAALEGWKADYGGAGLPAGEIVRAVERLGSDAVGLSLVHPAADPAVVAELRTLRRELPPGVAILAGGGAADSYAGVLEEIGALRPELTQLGAMLGTLRVHASRGAGRMRGRGVRTAGGLAGRRRSLGESGDPSGQTAEDPAVHGSEQQPV